jgi:hypothetical protein
MGVGTALILSVILVCLIMFQGFRHFAIGLAWKAGAGSSAHWWASSSSQLSALSAYQISQHASELRAGLLEQPGPKRVTPPLSKSARR